jgi:gliding motility-associated-like protein
MKNLSIFICFFITLPIFTQNVWINNGATVMNTSGVDVIVNGGVINQLNGTFDNSGTMHVFGDWTNNAGNTAFIPTSPGKVILEGANQQIQGTDITEFFRLELSGTGVKRLTDVYTIIDDSLILNDREFDLDTNTAFVTNPATGIITRSTGFCSSLLNGGLARTTNSTGTYLFPMGSSVGTARYRPVEIIPNNTATNVYKVRMANVDPSNEGFNIATKESAICSVNNLYYHKIWQLSGTSSADIAFYYDVTLDGNFSTAAHWQTIPQWEDMLSTTNSIVASPALSSITKSNWSNFAPYYEYALAITTPPVSLTTTPSPPTICSYDTLTFYATPGYVNYDYYLNGNIVQSGTDSILNLNGLSTGDSVYVIITDNLSCNAQSAAINNITVNPQPTITITSLPNDTVCSGSSVTLAGNGANTYNWDNGITDNTPFTATTSTTFTVIGLDANGCSDTTSVNLIVNPKPVISANAVPSSTICAQDTIMLYGSGANVFMWDNGITDSIPFVATTSNTYTVIGLDTNGCSDTSNISITVNPLPTVTILTNPGDSICLGDSTQVSASGNATTYTWNNSQTNNSYYVNTSTDSIIILTGVDANGCTNSDTTIIRVLPVPTLTLYSDTSICIFNSVQLQAVGTNIGYISWNNGTTLDDSTSTTPTATPNTTTTYIAVAGIGSCTVSDTVTVTVLPLPTVNAGNDTTILFGQSMVINATAPSGSYNWSPDDYLSCTNCLNPTANPEFDTEYILTVTDNNGCVNSDTIFIKVDLECTDLFVPNIFTPNGDGDSDYIKVLNKLCVQNMTFRIFDRWGNNVYSSTNPNEFWDGTYNGNRAETGVYVYVLKATLTSGKEILKKGNISLLK